VEKMRFSLKTSERTYSLKIRHTIRSIIVDVQPQGQTYGPECDKGLYFHRLSYTSCFPYSRVVLVEIRLIEDFPQIWRTRIIWNSRRYVMTQLSF
jgi:hypothetical protein